ncbi:MAG: gliding motility-associated C-terminal domain-containing protein [Bacteroidia bacterium]
MKKILLFFFLLTASSLCAQIEFSIRPHNVLCNNTEFGKIGVSVNMTYPPYTFSWSTGQVTDSIYGLTEGDYSVTITDALGNDTVASVHIGTNKCNMTPSVFITPNGDDIHDAWDIANFQFFPLARVIVFNRLGQKVFEHTGLYEPWDGKDLLGVTVPDASYFYVIYQDGNESGTIIKGSLTVLK